MAAAPASLYASQSVTATWGSILAPTATDWIGLYAVGAADSTVIAWQYTNGSASGSAPIVVPNTTAAGAYELRLFSNNSYTKLATSNGITVQPPPAANLAAAPASLYASQSVTATWSSILAPTANDWIGLYAVGAADSAVIAWQYASGSASGSVPIQVPNTTVAGAYELRLFANNSYTKLATSNGITVQPPPPATLSATGSASPGGSVTANWASILAPTANDWIGLYVPGAADSAVLSWHYTTGVAAGNVPVSLPANLAQGNYELRLFANNSYTKLATSATFGVGVKTLSFIHVDHLNTPRLIADDVGTTVWKWDQQEPFGNSVPNQDPGNTGSTFDFPLRFPGQYMDKETNLSYNMARNYSSESGRYVESDPIGLAGGLNTYLYAVANPISFSDKRGLDNPLLYSMLKNPPDAGPPIVVSGGVGGQLHIGPIGSSAESGIAFQITPPANICTYTQLCFSAGLGSVAGGLGISGQVQVGGGNLCNGSQIQTGVFRIVPGASLQSTAAEDGSISATKGMVDIGPTAFGSAAGAIRCETRYTNCLR